MIISNLEHLEVVTEETRILGGGDDYHDDYEEYLDFDIKKLLPIASADAESDALAIGTITSTKTSTNTQAVAGVFSKSNSKSSSLAIGDH